MVREHVAVITVNLPTPQDLESLSHERNAMRIWILRCFRRNGPPSCGEIDVLPPHPAHFATALCGEEHHEERIVERLRESNERLSFLILRLGLMQRRPEL